MRQEIFGTIWGWWDGENPMAHGLNFRRKGKVICWEIFEYDRTDKILSQ